jgi:hypothetical protein
MSALRVLVTEDERGAAQAAEAELRAAGHEVVRCVAPGEAEFPCAGLRSLDECPLRSGNVDVTLAVRAGASAVPARSEDGVLCSIRHRVPVVLAGEGALDPFDDWEAAAVADADDVVWACERTVAQPLRAHSEIAANAVADVLRMHGVEESALVSVRRHAGGLQVRVRVPEVSRKVRQLIGVRIVGALRAYDPEASGIDVSFAPTD